MTPSTSLSRLIIIPVIILSAVPLTQKSLQTPVPYTTFTHKSQAIVNNNYYSILPFNRWSDPVAASPMLKSYNGIL